ncbi:hypothetical protein BCR36DRAFT_413649 [Piromyces finnis]|uniref:G-protein coupled receptors family 3 profile domain-containing protein n=1 Tax=Piromyces finnis TaxID=1754191 RepID=A0A1Y1V4M4_9FUNG|nr:hypothetical protein BCR36DRAFT_413649 [Piromyces finnis]|eukprot:ORX47298.1 hypothetical protein BCR36DRAFT_413649 [Piromyces finnis]
MLNNIVLSVFLILSYFGYSIQNTINQRNVVNYIYNDDKCDFNILPINTELNENIEKCNDIINNVLIKKEEGKEIKFHGKIHISSSVFEHINEKTFHQDVFENIISQISMLLNNYRNKIYTWDVSDDLITNYYITSLIKEVNQEDAKSPIILNEENIYLTPYYNLLKKIFIIGNSLDQKMNINYHQSIDLDSFNYEEGIQKLSILNQIVHNLMEESIPIKQLQFEFFTSNEKDIHNKYEKAFQFISNLKLFSNLNIPLYFLIPNKDNHHDFDRFFQKCHKNNIKCAFSITSSIDNYSSEIAYNIFENDYNNNMSSYFNSSVNVITSQFYKRDSINLNYNISYYSIDNKNIESSIYSYNTQSRKLNNIPDMTYLNIYENFKKISIKEVKDNNDYNDLVTLNFCVFIDTSDNGNRKANYIFDALALWIQQKHQEKIDSQSKKNEYEIIVTVKNDRNEIICMKNEKESCPDDCPDFALLSSNDISIYYKKSYLLSLDKYIREYYKNYGITLESKIYKYAFYDYHIDNQWMAIPFTVQIRTLLFNSTTFDKCMNSESLRYPPPHNEEWDGKDNNKWDWSKFFEYSRKIKHCTKKNGITFFGENAEELKFLSMYVQSVGIPFIIENDYKVKMFATEKDEIDFADRFKDLKEVLKNHEINGWIKDSSIEKWRKSSYPNDLNNYPKFEKKSNYEILTEDYGTPSINGMAIANPEKMVQYFGNGNGEIKYANVPGLSSYYGGEGFVIFNSNCTDHKDEAFELITLFINNTLPFLHDANSYITPFEDTENMNCKQTVESINECNDYINNAISDIYYFIDRNNEYIIFSAKHIPSNKNENAKLVIEDQRILDLYSSDGGAINKLEYTCGASVDFQKKIITYSNNRIDLPILTNGVQNVLTIKSTNDYFSTNKNVDVSLCSITNDMLKIARPIQYPLNGFDKMNEIEDKELVSILFANIYYKHNDTVNVPLEKNLKEFKSLIDYHILPSCSDFLDTNFTLSECKVSTISQDVNYVNCKKTNDSTITSTVCNYIPYGNIISIITYIITGIFYSSGIVSLVLMIKYRKSKNLSAFGMDFSIILLCATFILTASVFFWLGEGSNTTCHFKIWLQTIGLTNMVATVLLKEERISSIFIGRDVQKIFTPKMKDIYIKLGVINLVQIVLLIIWSITNHEPYIQIQKYYTNLGYKKIEYCDIFSSRITAIIFLFIFCMIIYSLLISIKIRNIPKEFNESRFIISSSTFQIIMIFFVFFVCIITEAEVYRGICYILCMLFLILFTRPLFIEYKLYCIITKKTIESSIVIVNASSYISSSEKKSEYQTTQFKNTNAAITEVHSIF